MLRAAAIKRLGGVLLRTEGRSPPDGTSLRLKRPCQYFLPFTHDVCCDQTVQQVLKKDCVAALRRIFKLCDTNKDGILDAAELNEFQVS